MALLTWSNQSSVGVQTLDAQHQQLCAIVNELHEAMTTGQAKALTGALLRRLADYISTHFTAEETLLQNARYPALAAHRVEHRNLVRQVQDVTRRHERGEITVNSQLLHYLGDWLMNHIHEEDKKYGSWLNERGIS